LNAKQVLTITGTKSADQITLIAVGSDLLVRTGRVIRSFELSQVKKLHANLGGGDDVLVARGTMRFAMNIRGGSGNDELMGGVGDDRLDGGDGRDSLVGGAGRDVLIGGAGADLISASDGFVGLGATTTGKDRIFARDGSIDRIVMDSQDVIQKDKKDAPLRLNTQAVPQLPSTRAPRMIRM
jgi:Ca2+-binding RTX toxin-like protein